jgi:hypothetical protein
VLCANWSAKITEASEKKKKGFRYDMASSAISSSSSAALSTTFTTCDVTADVQRFRVTETNNGVRHLSIAVSPTNTCVPPDTRVTICTPRAIAFDSMNQCLYIGDYMGIYRTPTPDKKLSDASDTWNMVQGDWRGSVTLVRFAQLVYCTELQLVPVAQRTSLNYMLAVAALPGRKYGKRTTSRSHSSGLVLLSRMGDARLFLTPKDPPGGRILFRDAIPQGEALVPLVPEKETIVPQKGTIVPQRETIVPQRETIVPQEDPHAFAVDSNGDVLVNYPHHPSCVMQRGFKNDFEPTNASSPVVTAVASDLYATNFGMTDWCGAAFDAFDGAIITDMTRSLIFHITHNDLRSTRKNAGFACTLLADLAPEQRVQQMLEIATPFHVAIDDATDTIYVVADRQSRPPTDTEDGDDLGCMIVEMRRDVPNNTIFSRRHLIMDDNISATYNISLEAQPVKLDLLVPKFGEWPPGLAGIIQSYVPLGPAKAIWLVDPSLNLIMRLALPD